MFSKTDRNDKPERNDRPGAEAVPRAVNTGGRGAAPSLVSANLQVVGNLNTEGEIQIDGMVEGDVTCNKLTVGETKVTAEGTARFKAAPKEEGDTGRPSTRILSS